MAFRSGAAGPPGRRSAADSRSSPPSLRCRLAQVAPAGLERSATELYAASWKMIPSVTRSPECTVATPCRIVVR
jgi:hypothetical protein